MKEAENKNLFGFEEYLSKKYLGDYWKTNLPSENRWWIRNKLKGEINDLYTLTNQDKPPLDLTPLFPYRKILDIGPDTMKEGTEKALLLPIRKGFRIMVKDFGNIPKVNERYAIAHELSHTFLFDLEEGFPNIPYKKPFRGEFGYRETWEAEEFFVDEIARNILIPEKILLNYLEREKIIPNRKNLSLLSKIFQVDRNIMGFRLVSDLNLFKDSYYQGRMFFLGDNPYSKV